MKKYLSLICCICFIFISCHFASTLTEPKDLILNLDKTEVNLDVGEMDVISLTVSENQNNLEVTWEYDQDFIFAKTDNYSAVITCIKTGTTTIKAHCGNVSVSCIVNISEKKHTAEVANPYIYASTDVVTIKPLETIKISAALYGGTAADINGYSWSLDKDTVVTLTTEGNYAWLTGVNHGQTKLTIKHSKSSFPYTVLINCIDDGTNLPYLTTDNNIITINKDEINSANFKVELKNLPQSASQLIKYSIIDSDGNKLNDVDAPVSLSTISDNLVSVNAIKTGMCMIRCSHESVIYPLDIIVRVVESVDPIYLAPDKEFINVTNKVSDSVTITVTNSPKDFVFDATKLSWSFSENATEIISYEIVDDSIIVTGKKNGAVKITVSYPDSTGCTFLILSRCVETVDACCYITTSQNYVRMSLSDNEKALNVTIKNATSEDLKDLRWTITNLPQNSENKQVINWKSGDGQGVVSTNSRNSVLLEKQSAASCILEPISVGTAYIDVSHPKAMFSTRITVVVTEKSEGVKNAYFNLTESPIIKIKNGESRKTKIELCNAEDKNKISWQTNSWNNITLTQNEDECIITAPVEGSGASESTLTVKHPDVKNPLTLTVLCYDTEDELKDFNIKSIYSTDNTVINLKKGLSDVITIKNDGFGTQIPSLNINKLSGENCLSFEQIDNSNIRIYAEEIGQCVLSVSCDGCKSLDFVINIFDDNIIFSEKDSYISTNQNVVYFSKINETQNVSIQLFNISEEAYSQTVFALSNSNFEIAYNNNIATITAVVDNGNAVLSVYHPDSLNSLDIQLVVGERYLIQEQDFYFLSTTENNLDLFLGQEDVTLYASLMKNTAQSTTVVETTKGFTFKVENEDIVRISTVPYSNACMVSPKNAGTTKIIVSHTDSLFEKEVVIVVNPSINTTTPYLTCSTNVITLLTGEKQSIQAVLKNCTESLLSDWSWVSEDNSVVSLIGNNGSTALVSAGETGTTRIKVEHKNCAYPLYFIVIVIDSSIVKENPYIKISDEDNIIHLKAGESTTLTAQMAGGEESDVNFFRFKSTDSSVVLLDSGSNTTLIKAINPGICYVDITNEKYPNGYKRSVMIIVDDKQQSGIYIKPSVNIIKLKPNENVYNVTAELVGADVIESENLIWWADDYNLININSVANTCSIQTTGKSGTTKIRIKHGLAKQEVSILVLISEYDDFSFGEKSASLETEKIQYFPLEIPALSEDYSISYSSSDEDVCVVGGSNLVAFACGINPGTAILTAKLLSSDGTELDSSELLVSVSIPDINVPKLNLGSKIFTITQGESKVFKGIIEGSNVDSSKLKWSIKNATSTTSNDVSFLQLQDNGAGVVYGSECHLTFNNPKEYVLMCEYEYAPGKVIQDSIFINVVERGELAIELSSALETIYKDDGSITITAKIINGTAEDEKNLEWSATKNQDGVSVVAVTKTKGTSCTVSPKNMGQTNVIARLPNGLTASCIVIVKESVEIHLSSSVVRVNPGYTTEVKYSTTPKNTQINWIAQMNSNGVNFGDTTNYFTFEDDFAGQKLIIKGIKQNNNGAAGSIMGVVPGLNSSNLPTLTVHVQYNAELELRNKDGGAISSIYNNCPDTVNTEKFQIICYPPELNIHIKDNTTEIGCIPGIENGQRCSSVNSDGTALIKIGSIKREEFFDSSDKKAKARLTVEIIPKKEGSTNLVIDATLPEVNTPLATNNIAYSAYYQNYNIEACFDLIPKNAFSKYASGKVYLGDGEEVPVYFKIKNENATGKITGVIWNVKNNEVSIAKNSETNLGSESNIETDILKLNPSLSVKEKNDNIYNSNNTIRKLGKRLITINEKEQIIGEKNTKVYYIKHNYDFYRRLPELKTADGKPGWESYKNELVDYKNQNEQVYTDPQKVPKYYSEDIIEKLKNMGVEYWVIDKEMYIQPNSKYQMIKHPNTSNSLTAEWGASFSRDYRTWGNNYWGSIMGNNRVYLRCNYPNIITLFSTAKLDSSRYTPAELSYLFNYKYESCEPYVITTSELLNNGFFVRPETLNKYTFYYEQNAKHSGENVTKNETINISELFRGEKYIHDTHVSNWDLFESDEDDTVYHYNGFYNKLFAGCTIPGAECQKVVDHTYEKLPKLLHEYIRPTTSKDPTVVETKEATLSVQYVDANGTTHTEYNIPFVVEFRLCEAYSKQWKANSVNGFKRFYQNENGYKPLPNAIDTDYFYINRINYSGTTNNAYMNGINYNYEISTIYPESIEVSWTNPDTEKLTIEKGNNTIKITPKNIFVEGDFIVPIKFTYKNQEGYEITKEINSKISIYYEPEFIITSIHKDKVNWKDPYESEYLSMEERYEITIKEKNGLTFTLNDFLSWDIKNKTQLLHANGSYSRAGYNIDIYSNPYCTETSSFIFSNCSYSLTDFPGMSENAIDTSIYINENNTTVINKITFAVTKKEPITIKVTHGDKTFSKTISNY